MGRFKSFFKNRFRKEEPITSEETEFIHNLREALLHAQGSEVSGIPLESSSSEGFDGLASIVNAKDLPRPVVPSVSVEEQALEEDSTVDEIYAHHIRARISRRREASPSGK